jgi:hypothetical protein
MISLCEPPLAMLKRPKKLEIAAVSPIFNKSSAKYVEMVLEVI